MDNFGHQFKRTGGLLFPPIEPYLLYFFAFPNTKSVIYYRQ